MSFDSVTSSIEKNINPVDFGHAFFDSAVQKPYNAVSELSGDRLGHLNLLTNKSDTIAARAGNIAGLVVDMTILSKISRASLDPLLKSQGLASESALASALKSGASGALYGGIFTSSDTHQGLLQGRLKNAVVSAATFSVIGGVGSKLGETEALSSYKSSGKIIGSAFAGGTGGLVNAIVDAGVNSHALSVKAALHQTAEFAAFGAAFGALDVGIGRLSDSRGLVKIENAPKNDAVRKAQEYEAGSRSSFFDDVSDIKRFPTLKGVKRTHVAIVGGGIAGLTMADEWAAKGLSTSILEGSRIAGKTSGMMGAMMTRVPDLGYMPIHEAYGEETFGKIVRLYSDSQQKLMKKASEMPDVDFVRHDSQKIGYQDTDADFLKPRFDLLHRHDPNTSFVSGDDASARFAPARVALVYHGEGSLNIRKYALGLAESGNFKIYEDSPVTHVKFHGPNSPVEIRTADGGKLIADKVVFATGGNISPFAHLNKYMEPIQCFALSAKSDATLPGNIFDNLSPFRYFRQMPGGRVLLGGTARFLNKESALPEKNPQLSEALHEPRLFPDAVVEKQWTGTIFSTIKDGLPIIEQHSAHPQMYEVTGLGGIGLVNSQVTAKVLGDILTGSSHENLFSARRFEENMQKPSR